MDLRFKTISLAGLKNPFRLFCGKRLLFTEDIAKLRKSFLSYLRNHLFGQKGHIMRPILSEFFWKGVSPQKGGDDIDGMGLLQGLHHFKNLHFIPERKSVT